jgi:hypothetical protein
MTIKALSRNTVPEQEHLLPHLKADVDPRAGNWSRLENWASPCMIIITVIVILPKVLSSHFYDMCLMYIRRKYDLTFQTDIDF